MSGLFALACGILVCTCMFVLWQKIPEEQAFAVLVKIMFDYGHRNLFRSNFQKLHLIFFQLEKLIEVGVGCLRVKCDGDEVYV